ncbi:SUKH-4 family immunity protein [Kitasatospora sp. LaBMicrA B282]|uniref:SUKH-4 family immunity protein n=1 Tax=Kitasatospora sp. LaBMicrA B282 TaxID=3420949 RepID=UPI003D0AADA4
MTTTTTAITITAPQPFPESALPPELTHQPTRRRLLDHGLPAAGADITFRPTTEPLAPLAPGQPQHLVIGETWSNGPVVLDGATGRLYLAEWTGSTLERDLLATDLPALARLIEVVEGVDQEAARPEARDGRRGGAVFAEELAAATERLRAADPELHRAAEPPAYWGSVLLLNALSWGARPGGPGELAYCFEADLVSDLADLIEGDGPGEVLRYRPELLPAGLTHEPTRRLLTECGLPADAGLFAARPEPLPTLLEEFGDDAVADRPYQAGFLAIGDWPHDLEVALDGATGRLELPAWYDDDSPAPYLHRDLSALLYACWRYERLRADWDRWGEADAPGDWAVFDPRQVLLDAVDELVEEVDPESFATEERSWYQLANDAHTGGLLSN